MSIEPGRLLDIAGVGDPVSVCQDNFEALTEEIWKHTPTYQNGSPIEDVGPPTAGDHILDELWKDAWLAVYRCTAAGLPGTWRQEKPAVRAGEPSSSPNTIPTGYLILDSSDHYTPKEHMGSYVWRRIGTQLFTELTGLSGGGSLNLDGVVTADMSAGRIATFLVSGAVVGYRLRAGTDSESSPWIIRPDDYAASTNEKVWERILWQDYPGHVTRQLNELGGGTDEDLNSIPTVNLSVETFVSFINSGDLVHYRLKTGTDATSLPNIVRPADYNGVSNAKIWVLNRGRLRATATLDFGSIAAAASADLTITVTGAAVGDPVAVGTPAAPAAGIVFWPFISAADTVTVRAMNITAAPVDPASADYSVEVFKKVL